MVREPGAMEREPAPDPLAERIAEARRTDTPPWSAPYRNLGALLAARATTRGSAPFLSYLDEDLQIVRRWTYADTALAAGRAAAQLRGFGIEKGARVAILSGNLDHAIVLYLAIWSLGGCVVPLNAAESEERKAFILEDSGARVLFARTTFAAEAQRLARGRGIPFVALAVHDVEAELESVAHVYPRDGATLEPEPLDREELAAADCEAVLVYTSGTTGAPKGVLLDQHNVLAAADAMAAWHGWDEHTRMLCVLPIHHVNGMIVSHVTSLYAGGSCVLQSRFQSETFWRCVELERITNVSVVPTLLEFLLDAGAPAGPVAQERSLQTVLCGAGPLLVDTALAFEARFGVPVIHGYGLSETTAYNCQLPVDLSDAERRSWLGAHGFPSIGCALPHQELAIRRADGTFAVAAERGEICIRGEVVSRGYWMRNDANRDVFRDGWLHSGDEGFFLPGPGGRPFFFISGRIKELIIRGGINYSPLEIDRVLSAHPAVHYALAFPFENRYYGEEVAAYVVPRKGCDVTEQELVSWCRERLDFARGPKVVLFGDDIPYTSTGKPKRIELARKLATSLARFRDVQFGRPGKSIDESIP
jgi:long-chain acyl-CoA synthetase